MSKQTQKLFEQIKDGEPPMGAIGTIQAVLPGLSLGSILGDIGAELGRLGVQGQMEMASALFNGSAFVPYGPGQYTPSEPDHGLPIETMIPPEVEQSMGREM